MTTMSDQPIINSFRARSDQIRSRLNQLRRSRHSMFGAAEIIGLAGSVFILLVVIASYVYFLVPARSRLESQQMERSRLQNLLRSSQEIVHQGANTRAMVERITDSLEKFETNQLVSRDQGRMGLYDELNNVIRNNALRNTSGPTYTLLDPAGAKTSAGSRSAATKWQSFYPGIAVSLTVEGQYQNLRHFVRDIESNKQFIIINAVELERATETNYALPAEGNSVAAPRASLVSLHLDMTTYFQRGAVQSAAAPGPLEH